MEKTPTRTPWDSYVPVVTQGNKTTAYLTEAIADTINYNELIHKLNTAQDFEEFELVICTPGGDVSSGLAIRNAIINSKAFVTGRLTGSVASAGTMISLACDDLIIEDNLSFMCHEVSLSGVQGKFSDIHTMQEFYKNHFAQISKDVYSGFLSDEEIEKMHQGKELWFTGEEVQERWLALNTPEPIPEPSE